MVDAASTPTEVAKLGFHERIRENLLAFVKVFGKDTRKPMFLGVFMMRMQQLGGIDGVIYVSFSPSLFDSFHIFSSFPQPSISDLCVVRTTTLPTSRSLLRSHFPCVRHLCHPHLRFHDPVRPSCGSLGRRPSTIYGGLVLLTYMSIMAFLYSTNNVHSTHGVGRWMVIVSIYVFAVGYSMSKSCILLRYLPVNSTTDKDPRTNSLGNERETLRLRNPTCRHSSHSHKPRSKR